MPAPRNPALPRVLLTGFDAFGGQLLNPSSLAVQALAAQGIAGCLLDTVTLPTVFDRCVQSLMGALDRFEPDLVVCVGQAAGRRAISLERIAINVDDARIPDNTGHQPIDTPVVPGAPAGYFSTLPIKAMLLALQQAGIGAEISQTAGTYVCNHLFFALMHAIATSPDLQQCRGGFIHLPWLPGQGEPCLALDQMVRGLGIALACALQTRHDLVLPAGALR